MLVCFFTLCPSCSVVNVFPLASMASGWTPLESLFLHVDSTTAGFPVSPCDTSIILHARAVTTQRIVLLLFV